MIYPSIKSVMKNFDSKYSLVITTAKRARQLEEGAPKLVNCKSDKSVTIAIHEIDEGKIVPVRK